MAELGAEARWPGSRPSWPHCYPHSLDWPKTSSPLNNCTNNNEWWMVRARSRHKATATPSLPGPYVSRQAYNVWPLKSFWPATWPSLQICGHCQMKKSYLVLKVVSVFVHDGGVKRLERHISRLLKVCVKMELKHKFILMFKSWNWASGEAKPLLVILASHKVLIWVPAALIPASC